MDHSTGNRRAQGTTRRVFLKQVFALTSVSAGAALLNACGSSGATATTVPAAAQLPTALPATASAPAAPTATSAAAPTSEATTGATTTAGSNTAQAVTPAIVAAANAFLGTLSDSEKDTGLFDWSDTAQKQRWSNFPPAGFQRAGLMWGNMSEAQQNAWLALMQATLGTEGYNRINAEWSADDALLAQEGTGGGFGKNNYYIDLVLGPGQDGKTIQAEGLPASQMTADQKAAFLKLVGHCTGLANDATAAARTAEVQSTLDQTYFAWYGPTTQGSAAYFRVTGPTIVIEFSPQGGGGPGSNTAATDLHIHGIYRDPTNDYGAKYTGISIGS